MEIPLPLQLYGAQHFSNADVDVSAAAVGLEAGQNRSRDTPYRYMSVGGEISLHSAQFCN